MPEKFETLISPEVTPQPHLLDVVKINGRWAQVIDLKYVKYLDNENVEEINWDEFNWQRGKNIAVRDLIDHQEIDRQQYMTIHWGSEQEERPHLRDFVTVFGEYNKK